MNNISEKKELELLRIFYKSWKGLHSLRANKSSKLDQEQAAQNIVSASDEIELHYFSLEKEKLSSEEMRKKLLIGI